jgi:hypothetical protein
MTLITILVLFAGASMWMLALLFALVLVTTATIASLLSMIIACLIILLITCGEIGEAILCIIISLTIIIALLILVVYLGEAANLAAGGFNAFQSLTWIISEPAGFCFWFYNAIATSLGWATIEAPVALAGFVELADSIFGNLLSWIVNLISGGISAIGGGAISSFVTGIAAIIDGIISAGGWLAATNEGTNFLIGIANAVMNLIKYIPILGALL